VAWGPAGTWEEIAETYWEHAADRVTDMADTRVTGRTPGLNSEFACRLDQVQAGVRYVAIALGPGGWIPHAAGDVLNRGFGDCKDMSTLLLSLLGGPRSQASLALVLTSPPAAADVDPLPSLALFNHAVVCASGNNGDVWLDATDRHATMTSPRADIQGSPALVVSGAGRGYRRIPRAEPDRNRVERSIGIRPGVSGSWQLHATIRFQGTPRSDFLHTLEKLDLEDRDHRRNTLAWVLGLTEADLIYGPTTIDVDHTDPDVLSLKLLAKVTGMDAGTGGGMRLKAAWSPEPEPFDLFQARSRESDVYWPALGVVVDTLTVHARPVPDLVDTTWSSSVEGIAVSASRRVEPNRVVLAREVRVEEPVFPAAAWKEARSLRNRVRRWSSTVIPIVSPQ
ncbi:MAG TPA: hypothetical protein VGC81_13620, partial [Candidatus Methylomirabilis sp.]